MANFCGERGNRSMKGMLEPIFSRGFHLWNVCGRQDRDFGYLARRASSVGDSTALPSSLDGTKEVGLSNHTAITLCQGFSFISARPPGRSWKEARKAESEFPEVPTSLQRPAGQPL